VKHAHVALLETAAAADADSSGVAKLDVTSIPDGNYCLRLTKENPVTSISSDDMGPLIAIGLPDPPQRIYRALEIAVSIKGGKLTQVTDPYDPSKGLTDGQIGNRKHQQWSADCLPIDWRPIWIRCDHRYARKATPIGLIVIHETGGEPIGPNINEAITHKGPHYEIDKDGHIVKFVQDDQVAYHAGYSRWGSQPFVKGDGKYVNPYSIGIELVNRTGPLTDLQYSSLLKLLNTLVATFAIPNHRIVGHSDIATGDKSHNKDDTLLDDRRSDCPGRDFDWERLEQAGLGMIPTGTDLGNYYGGYFSTYSEPWKTGDEDNTQKYGGKIRKDIPLASTEMGPPVGPILELQMDLKHIGYSVYSTGKFDSHTKMAVDRFQRHFFSANRKSQIKDALLGHLDAMTANWIKCVRAAIP